MEERRSGVDRRADHARKASDRRRVASLVNAPPVRRIFPIADPVDVFSGKRQRAKRDAITVADTAGVAFGIALPLSLAGSGTSTLGLFAAMVAGLLVVRAIGLHDRDLLVLRRSTLDEVPRLAEVAGIVAAGYWILFGEDLSRWALPGLWATTAVGMVASRAAARSLVRKALPVERCLFIGDMAVADTVKAKIENGRACASVVAALDLKRHQTADAIGGIDGLRRLVEAEHIDRLVLAPSSTDAAATLELIRIAKLIGVQVSIFPRLFEVVGSALEFEQLEGLTLMGVRRFGLTRGARAVKRAFDVMGASVALLLFAPLMAVIAVAIKLDSRGPVLFRQPRIGRDGRQFCIYKFRSMVPEAEALKAQLRKRDDTRGLFKLEKDPRITRVGGFLRKTSLDELPQLFNVFRGDMSLVGPRPLVPDEDAQVLGLDRSRLHLTPGMTGPWQVMRSGRVPIEEMVTIDYLYVVNWSLWTDLKLMIRTVGYMLAKGGM